MAITDLQISDTLATSAPSIKYTGNEGPQAPQQMASDPSLEDSRNEMSLMLFNKPIHELTPEELDLLNDHESQQAPQQDSGIMKAAYGGMMRQKYGLGKFVRKLIPNEIAAVAEKAAPFVAPFNPIAGGLMAGIGGYDRTGNLMGSAARGLGTYGLGQGARFLGGAELQPGLSLKMPGGASSGIGQYFSKPYQPGQDIFSKTKERFFPGKEEITEKVFKEQMSPGQSRRKYIDPQFKSKKIIEKTDTGKLGKFIESLTDTTAKKIILGSMVGTGIYTAYTQGKAEIADLAQVARGEGLDIAGIRAEVQEALAGGEEAWNELKRTKYPYMGEFPTKKAEGGRIGLYAGGVPSPYSMEDARKTSMQDKMGGITDVMKRADLFRSGDVGQMYMAQGGRIGYADGSPHTDPKVFASQLQSSDTRPEILSLLNNPEYMQNLIGGLKAQGRTPEEIMNELQKMMGGGISELSMEDKSSDTRPEILSLLNNPEYMQNLIGGLKAQGRTPEEIMNELQKMMGGGISELSMEDTTLKPIAEPFYPDRFEGKKLENLFTLMIQNLKI